MTRILVLAAALGLLSLAPLALANHAGSCTGCADHKEWPRINGIIRKAHDVSKTYTGTRRNDELLGHHGSDHLYGKAGSDVLWGDWQGPGQPTSQKDTISGGDGTDFIYASHGINHIDGGAGNDAISAHYGRGTIDCGPGRDIYHVPKSLKGAYKVRNCEKVDRRSEKQRGGGLEPLS
jgi:Ca2+-binding RTX toxin-like protein